MKEIQIQIPELHPGQLELLDKAKRFNVVRCGRRWGKTVTASELLIQPALDGFPTAYFTPVYKTLEEVWNEVIDTLEPLISKKNSQQKYIKLLTGGKIDFWSLKDGNAPRGRKYKRIVVDEAAFIDELEDKFNKTLRAFLTDYQGDGWFLSTPNGHNDFWKLDEKSKTNKNWQSFHQPTHKNPFISLSELDEIEEELPKDVFDQEYKALYVNFDGKNFLQYFSREKNVKEGLKFDPNLDIFMCWDFNVTNTVLIIQNPAEKHIRVLREYHLDMFDITSLCDVINVDYSGFLRINGDASGSNQSALTTGNASAYQIIKEHIDISWEQFNVPAANPSHLNSYIQCNYVFKNWIVEIDSSCTGLINDCERVKVQKVKNKFEIIKTDEKLTHHLDPLRYHIYAEHSRFIGYND